MQCAPHEPAPGGAEGFGADALAVSVADEPQRGDVLAGEDGLDGGAQILRPADDDFAAALAGGNDYLTPTDNTGVVQSIWTTDTDGTVTIQGLRYSGWANGGVVNVGDAGYQSYWLVEVTALEGHQLFPEPIEIVIDDASVTQTSQTIVNQANEGGFVLPLTGGMGTAILTIGGVAILATVILLARRRSRSDDTVAAA